MPIPFTCPHCQARTEVDEKYAGQSGPCATCGKTITVPDSNADKPALPVTATSDRSTGLMLALAIAGMIAFALLLVGGMVISWLIPAAQFNSTSGQTQNCRRNLQRIAQAIDAYVAEHGTYPPAFVADADGKPLHSWRVLLLPYLGEDGLYSEYNMNEPWNSPANSSLAGRMPSVYGCPADTALDYNETSYVVLRGEGMAFVADKGIAPSALQDGLSNTILVAEVANSATNWLDPRDLDVNTTTWQPNTTANGLGCHHPGGGMHVLLADGSTVRLVDHVPGDQLRAMATVDGGENVDPYDWAE